MPLCKLLYLIWHVIALRLCWMGFVKSQIKIHMRYLRLNWPILLRSTESKIRSLLVCWHVTIDLEYINKFCICFSPFFIDNIIYKITPTHINLFIHINENSMKLTYWNGCIDRQRRHSLFRPICDVIHSISLTRLNHFVAHLQFIIIIVMILWASTTWYGIFNRINLLKNLLNLFDWIIEHLWLSFDFFSSILIIIFIVIVFHVPSCFHLFTFQQKENLNRVDQLNRLFYHENTRNRF